MKRYEYRIVKFHVSLSITEIYDELRIHTNEGFRWIRTDNNKAILEREVEVDSTPDFRLGDCARDEAISWLVGNLDGDNLRESLDWMLRWANLRASNIVQDIETPLREIAGMAKQIKELCSKDDPLKDELAESICFIAEQALKRTLLVQNGDDDDDEC